MCCGFTAFPFSSQQNGDGMKPIQRFHVRQVGRIDSEAAIWLGFSGCKYTLVRKNLRILTIGVILKECRAGHQPFGKLSGGVWGLMIQKVMKRPRSSRILAFRWSQETSTTRRRTTRP